MKRTLKWLGIIAFGTIVSICLIIGNRYLQNNKLCIYATGSNEKAFLNSTWAMSPPEIERSNNTHLIEPKIDLLRLPDKGYSEVIGSERYAEVISAERYKTLVQRDIRLWGNDSWIEYGFFDNKLFTYAVFLKIYNKNEMLKTIVDSLSEKYGEYHKQEYRNLTLIPKEDGLPPLPPLDLEGLPDQYLGHWETDKVTIHLWLAKDSIIDRLILGFTVGANTPFLICIRFDYKPAVEAIKQSGEGDHKHLF